MGGKHSSWPLAWASHPSWSRRSRLRELLLLPRRLAPVRPCWDEAASERYGGGSLGRAEEQKRVAEKVRSYFDERASELSKRRSAPQYDYNRLSTIETLTAFLVRDVVAALLCDLGIRAAKDYGPGALNVVAKAWVRLSTRVVGRPHLR